MGSSTDKKSIGDLVAIMRALRDPETGCPWDREQTFDTIAPYTIEEAYEVADAIERSDRRDLRDELGDLLLQVVYHAQMAAEEDAFDFTDVVDGICAKMVRRHPHVFGDKEVRSTVELKGLWERIKQEEKAARGDGDTRSASLLDGVPTALPALTRAIKLQNKAARVGFDWPNIMPVLDKIREELDELEAEISDADKNRQRLAEEYGDLLFVLANLARHLRIDPEAAIRATNAKFARRFARIEALLEASGRRPDECDLAELDRLWDQAKAEEKNS
ncbi:MAG: nucleoside triphosphate pyrophosphohydrolase [Hyphomicrobiales bacterium]|nr:nucleoside triphosphate pyrophosphohydrolase [Hyphomicrobiales bacterium]